MSEESNVDLALRIRAFADLRAEQNTDISTRVAGAFSGKYQRWIRDELFRLTYIHLPEETQSSEHNLQHPNQDDRDYLRPQSPFNQSEYSDGFSFEVVEGLTDLNSYLSKELVQIVEQITPDKSQSEFLDLSSERLQLLISRLHLRSGFPIDQISNEQLPKGRPWFVRPLFDDSGVNQTFVNKVRDHRNMILRLLCNAADRDISQYINVGRLSVERTPRIAWSKVIDQTLNEYLSQKEIFLESGNFYVPRPAEIMTVAIWAKERPDAQLTDSNSNPVFTDDYRFILHLAEVNKKIEGRV